MAEVFLIDVGDGVAVVTLNRPDARKALNTEPRRTIPMSLRHLDADPESVPAQGLAGIKAAYRAAAAPHDDAAIGVEQDDSRQWSRTVSDPATLATNRESIQARGREQHR
jgi:hypothetical protein